MLDEITLEALDLIDLDYNDAEIVGSLIKTFRVDTAEASATLDEALQIYARELEDWFDAASHADEIKRRTERLER